MIGIIGISLFGSECPDLSKKGNVEIGKGIKEGMIKSVPNIYEVYSDALKNYNKVENEEEYIDEEVLKSFTTSYTYGALIALKTMKDKEETYKDVPEEKRGELKSILENKYKEIIREIKPENKEWCNEKGISLL